MSDELFPYYDSELAYLRQMGYEFSRAHPAAASALGLDDSVGEGQRDPHVERLLQGVAFLNARIQHRLDDDFPQLSETLLNTLYPHYLAPFPSCAIVEFGMDEARLGKDAATGITLAQHAPLEIQPGASGGAPLRYQTAYPVRLLPIRIAALKFRNQRFDSPPGTRPREAVAAVQLDLETMSSEITFADLAAKAFTDGKAGKTPDTLPIRLFLHGPSKTVHGLYDQFLRSAIRVVICDPNHQQSATKHPPAIIAPVGFGDDELLLPRDARILHGYRLLHEYFAFDRKFHFVEIAVPRACLDRCGSRLQVIVMTTEENTELAETATRDNLRLGCTPVVNLFPMRAEFPRTYRQTEYRLIVDAGAPLDYEIFRVDRVRVVRNGQHAGDYRAFYDVYHGAGSGTLGYWHAARQPDASGQFSDVYLSLVDQSIHPSIAEYATVAVDVLCMNRNLLSSQIGQSFDADGTSRAQVQLAVGDATAGYARLVTRPTPSQRRAGSRDWRWRLCSHLALNHLSLTDAASGPDALKEILWLYNISDSPTAAERIEGLDSVRTESERITRRVAPGPHGFVQGNRVMLSFREAAYPDGGLFLFASVLRAFLASYVTINSFVETRFRTIDRRREYTSWPALSGTRPLL